MYQAEYLSAFFRYYAIWFYVQQNSFDEGDWEYWLFRNEQVQWSEAAEAAYDRGE